MFKKQHQEKRDNILPCGDDECLEVDPTPPPAPLPIPMTIANNTQRAVGEKQANRFLELAAWA